MRVDPKDDNQKFEPPLPVPTSAGILELDGRSNLDRRKFLSRFRHAGAPFCHQCRPLLPGFLMQRRTEVSIRQDAEDNSVYCLN